MILQPDDLARLYCSELELDVRLPFPATDLSKAVGARGPFSRDGFKVLPRASRNGEKRLSIYANISKEDANQSNLHLHYFISKLRDPAQKEESPAHVRKIDKLLTSQSARQVKCRITFDFPASHFAAELLRVFPPDPSGTFQVAGVRLKGLRGPFKFVIIDAYRTDVVRVVIQLVEEVRPAATMIFSLVEKAYRIGRAFLREIPRQNG